MDEDYIYFFLIQRNQSQNYNKSEGSDFPANNPRRIKTHNKNKS